MQNPDSNFTIRLAEDADFDRIYEIWTEGVENSFDVRQFDEVDLKEKFRQNFNDRQGIFNFWIAVGPEDTILGWQSLIRVSNNPFRQHTMAESSTYVSKNNRFKNLGKILLDHVLQEAENSSLEYVIGFVALNNEAAKKITRETGWIELGAMPLSKSNKELPKSFLVRPV